MHNKIAHENMCDFIYFLIDRVILVIIRNRESTINEKVMRQV